MNNEDLFEFLEFLDNLNDLDMRSNARPRVIRQRLNNFQNYDELDFFKRYRMSKATVLLILHQIDEELEYDSDRYTMEQMFDVVSDVENYYKFVPWCKQSIILKKTPDHLKADLIVGFPPINESYTSSVTLVRPNLVRAECTDGRLFNQMLTLWRFSPGLKRVEQSCVIDFQISFEFKSAFHSQLSNLFFDQVARQMENAFIKEAGRRNGPATMQPINLLNTNQTARS